MREDLSKIYKSCIAPEGVYFLGGKVHIVCFYGTPCLVKMCRFLLSWLFKKKSRYKLQMEHGLWLCLSSLPTCPFYQPHIQKTLFSACRDLLHFCSQCLYLFSDNTFWCCYDLCHLYFLTLLPQLTQYSKYFIELHYFVFFLLELSVNAMSGSERKIKFKRIFQVTNMV